MTHPKDALFAGEKPFPIVPSCEHFAGSEKLITRALELQEKNPTFDLTMDCEDGAPAGREKEHAQMIVEQLRSPANHRRMAGVRIHDYTHPHWGKDVDIVVGGAAEHLAYLTIAKPTAAAGVKDVIRYVQTVVGRTKLARPLPIHVTIETHGALREVFAIAALPWVQVLDFGLMDFVSGHHGALPASAMRSPGQFEHRLVVRAKAEVCAAAFAHGVVPSHNVTLDLEDVEQTRSDARRARQDFGFLRMWSIHPAQIEPIVAALAPDFAEVTRACEILLSAQRASWGPIQHGGELHDRATFRYFWELVQRARLSGQALPPEAEAAFYGAGDAR